MAKNDNMTINLFLAGWGQGVWFSLKFSLARLLSYDSLKTRERLSNTSKKRKKTGSLSGEKRETKMTLYNRNVSAYTPTHLTSPKPDLFEGGGEENRKFS